MKRILLQYVLVGDRILVGPREIKYPDISMMSLVSKAEVLGDFRLLFTDNVNFV